MTDFITQINDRLCCHVVATLSGCPKISYQTPWLKRLVLQRCHDVIGNSFKSLLFKYLRYTSQRIKSAPQLYAASSQREIKITYSQTIPPLQLTHQQPPKTMTTSSPLALQWDHLLAPLARGAG
ncbi:hypothetical protein FOIG_01272 [Fusarium odoratissimum NRRL 54006]|uniref:Uncharacterized protein n=2 Tax=Fusarium oxysporum species complex TaxID=171631 RepID=X0KSH4_FUSO5|nr:uncharacterized protein FOIG_01272 [Fusarium odoratissimum NRRL 54006]EXM11727.1 hypothetical protein FOIG_01272 [Fusarium odoratissimum NRRL 54006]TXC04215.1 hypothetical protein FocTR4_00000877 [Fusarium oxysporum f. sp. cubense]